MINTDILNLPAEVCIKDSLDDSQLIRPDYATSEEGFASFVKSKQCPICLGVPRFPVSICRPDCGHEGCFACLKMFSTCPVGRCTTYNYVNLLQFKNWPQRAKASFKQDLVVKCNKCDSFKSGTLDQLIHHEKMQCPKRIVRCPKNKCEKKGTPEYILKHFAECTTTGEVLDGEVTMHHIAKWSKIVKTVLHGSGSETPQAVPYPLERTRRTLFDL
jgi:hypothetical protein